MYSSLINLKNYHRGLLICITVAICSSFLSEHYGAPIMLFALLLGMAFHFLYEDERCSQGIDFAAKKLLRIGVALLGFRISISDVTDQSFNSVIAILALVAITIISGLLLAPVLKLNKQLGLLTGSAVAICGASAALAIAAVMPKREGLEEDTLFTVIAVTTLSTIAMVFYPIIFSLLGFSETQSGFLLGATIHDVAQVVGAGYSLGENAGDIATLTKFQRILLLPLVILVFSVSFRNCKTSQSGLPLFVIMFIIFVLINSSAVIPSSIVNILIEASRWFLIIAISALGMKTSLGHMLKLGSKHIIIVCLQTLLLLFAAIGLIYII